MTTLTNRPKTALIVIDVQNGVREKAHDRDTVIANIALSWTKRVPPDADVVWVQHTSDELQGTVRPGSTCPNSSGAMPRSLVHKEYGDSSRTPT